MSIITDFQGCCDKAKGLALKALEIDHRSVEGHAALAFANPGLTVRGCQTAG